MLLRNADALMPEQDRNPLNRHSREGIGAGEFIGVERKPGASGRVFTTEETRKT